ncbi:MAG: hypothetical protein ACI81O_000700 [Cyclobacteriaceae bacterium]
MPNEVPNGLRSYLLVTLGYWGFTITDGALRMLVVLYFHLLGYSPLAVASLFLFYEFFGIVTNLVGGWLGSRIGLSLTMLIGMALQVLALGLLLAPDSWLSVAYVMFAQALSGIAKDLNKMAAKASIKVLLPSGATGSRMFRWVAVLTGSKNALKGFGFFVGAGLLQWLEFRGAIAVLAGGLLLVLGLTAVLLPGGLGKTEGKPAFRQIFASSAAVNRLAAARFFLFGARDIWFVVALPVYLTTQLDWLPMTVGAFMALWIIGYGVVQASAPRLLRQSEPSKGPTAAMAMRWVGLLAIIPALLAMALALDLEAGGGASSTTITTTITTTILVVGLMVFGGIFAINSAVHSYLIVAWSSHERVAMNVGFYYMANAGGRLTGTVLSGLIYQLQGLQGCLWGSAIMLLAATLLSVKLAPPSQAVSV